MRAKNQYCVDAHLSESMPAFVDGPDKTKRAVEVLALMKPRHRLYESSTGELYSAEAGWGIYDYLYDEGPQRTMQRIYAIIRSVHRHLGDMDARTLLSASAAIAQTYKYINKATPASERDVILGYMYNAEQELRKLSIQKLTRDMSGH